MKNIVAWARPLSASARRDLILSVLVAAAALCARPENGLSQSAWEGRHRGRWSATVSAGALVHGLEEPLERRGFQSDIIGIGWTTDLNYRVGRILSIGLLAGQVQLPSAERGTACGWVCEPANYVRRSLTQVSSLASLGIGSARFGIGPSYYSRFWQTRDAEDRDSKVGILFDLTVGDSVASGLRAEVKLQYRSVGNMGFEVDAQRLETDYDHFLLAVGLGYRL